MYSYLDGAVAPKNHNPEAPPFSLLVDLFNKVTTKPPAGARGVLAHREHVVTAFIDHYRVQFGNDFSQVVRLVFPQRDGRSYNMKELGLNRLMIKLLNIAPGSSHYAQLANWQKSYQWGKKVDATVLADLPHTIVQILALRGHNPTTSINSGLSVIDINNKLDELAAHTSSASQLAVLRTLFDQSSLDEIRWLLTIILKSSILGRLESSFLYAYHPDAPSVASICNNLTLVFANLPNPQQRPRPDQLQCQLFHSFIPQSSHKLTTSYEKLCTRMSLPNLRIPSYQQYVDPCAGRFIIEEKLDGDRMLMHMVNLSYPHSYDNLQFKYYSRRRKDYTFLYGATNASGSLSPHLSKAFASQPMVQNIILDGEMVAWDKTRELVLPFGTLKSAAIQESVRQFSTVDAYGLQGSQPLFMVFDIIRLNNTDLTQSPLCYRKHVLHRVVHDVPHRFEKLDYQLARDPNDIKHAIQRVVSERAEGVMVKSIASHYHYAQRSSSWIKIKPEYLENFGENVDVVVIGQLKRQKTGYICALYDTQQQVFLSFCKVANGFSYSELRSIDSLTRGKWHDFKRDKPPSDLMQFASVTPDEWIDPHDLSLVLEIKARSIDTRDHTSMYRTPNTLHGLWCRSVRQDKSWQDAETLQSYLHKKQNVSINENQRVNRKRRLKPQDSFLQRLDKVPKVELSSTPIFSGFTFQVLSDYKLPHGHQRVPAAIVSGMVRQYGASVVQDLSHVAWGTIVVVSERSTPTTQQCFKQGWDIVKPAWIWQCLRRGCVVPLEPQFVLMAHPELEAGVQSAVDEFGDSFTVEIDPRLPIAAFLGSLHFPQRLTSDSFAASRHSFLSERESPPLCCIFTDVAFYVVVDDAAKYQLGCLTRKIRRYGGEVTSDTKQCSFVVVLGRADGSVKAVSKQLARDLHFDQRSSRVKVASIVTAAFVDRCIEDRVLVDPLEFKYI